jgi:hypothetical protein
MDAQLMFVIVAVALLAVVSALAPVIRGVLAGGDRKEELPYEPEEGLFTAAERFFLGELARVAGERRRAGSQRCFEKVLVGRFGSARRRSGRFTAWRLARYKLFR